MALGGNKKMNAFLQKFDLNGETVQNKFNTIAAHHYRLSLRSEDKDVPFLDEPPTYDKGKEVISEEFY